MTSKEVIDPAGSAALQVYDPVAGGHGAPEHLGLVGAQPGASPVGGGARGIAVHAPMGARVVFPYVDAFDASASIPGAFAARLERYAERHHPGPVHASAGLDAEFREVPVRAAHAQRQTVLASGAHGHADERVLLRPGYRAERSGTRDAQQFAVHVDEAEDASVGPFRRRPAKEVEFAGMVSEVLRPCEDHGVVPPDHPVASYASGDFDAGVVHVGFGRNARLQVLSIGRHGHLEQGDEPHGADLPHVGNHRCRILGGEHYAVDVLPGQAYAVHHVAGDGVPDEGLSGAKAVHQPS